MCSILVMNLGISDIYITIVDIIFAWNVNDDIH